jgi:hypothetical protein
MRKNKQYISTKRKDHCFMLNNENIAFLREKRANGDLMCEVLNQKRVCDFFDSPCSSKLINIGFVRDVVIHESSRMQMLKVEDLQRKAVCLPYMDGKVIFPLLHNTERR